jgi:hypothetical protein
LISILTCPARGQYLAATVASLERAGAAKYSGPKVIHVDGPADLRDFPGWTVRSLGPRVGARRAMLAIMARAAALDVETLLYFEDDVLLCKNAIPAMLEIGVPAPLGFVSYCDLAWHVGPTMQLCAYPGCPQNAPVPVDGFVGCQALALPLRTLVSLSTRPAPAWLDRNNCDSTIGTCAAVYGIVASLANHVGMDSAIMGRTYARLHQVRGWQGEDFDAATVPRGFELGPIGVRCPFHAGALHADGRPCGQSSPHHDAMRAPPALD